MISIDDGTTGSGGSDALAFKANLFGLGAGEFRVRVDDVSDLAGDGLARIGTSNLAGLAELDGIVIGLPSSLGDDERTLALLDRFPLWPVLLVVVDVVVGAV